MLQLNCTAQSYAWGIEGSKSSVAKFKKAGDSSFEVDEDKYYAELWMGTHPSGPAKLKHNNELLLSWLADKPASVGSVPTGYPYNNLPFLFKVLSVRTALSLQTHPNKTLAQELHSKFPDVYKDPNHKPEMVIALTEFECMCGFRTLSAIHDNILAYPELQALIDYKDSVSSEIATTKDAIDSGVFSGATVTATEGPESALLKKLFDRFMTCPEDTATVLLQQLVSRLEVESADSVPTVAGTPPVSLASLMLRLHSQFPGDKGVFAPLLMNFVTLQPGESFFIGANELHAYVLGECVECMALSDNVVRAGLTPKLKDSATLCAMLTYKSRLPNFLTPLPLDDYTVLYRPPSDCCAEFEVEKIVVPANTSSYTPLTVPCGSMIIMIVGGSTTRVAATATTEMMIQDGAVLFVAANEQIRITTGVNEATFYRAHVNLG
mmetsp:Transcript_22841/g.38223  ORF Transcript_22841/g.38223 Transcript_22841/m.38223 type:complete len:436 (-) Transcript_22841:1175-2482(-)